MNAAYPLPPPGDPLSQWVHEHGRAVRGYLRAMVRSEHEAEDLWQEVFRRAWQSRHSYQEQGTSRAYLLRIADHLVYDRQRRAGREVQLDDQDWHEVEPTDMETEPAQLLIHEETRQQLAHALDRLTSAQRRVLLLRFYGNLGFAEIAATVQWPLNTVLSHCRRGLLALRKQLSESAP